MRTNSTVAVQKSTKTPHCMPVDEKLNDLDPLMRMRIHSFTYSFIHIHYTFTYVYIHIHIHIHIHTYVVSSHIYHPIEFTPFQFD